MIELTKSQKRKLQRKLNGKSVADIVGSPEFLRNAEELMKQQVGLRLTAKASIPADKRLKSHVIDRIMEKGYLSDAMAFVWIYIKVLSHESGLSASERKYIEEFGTKVYINTIQEML